MTIEKKDEQSTTEDKQTQTRETTAPVEMSVEDALARIAHLESVNKEVIESRDKAKTKLRTFEQMEADQERTSLEEQGKYKELLEAEQAKGAALQQTLRDTVVDRSLDVQLQKSGLSEDAIGTAKALINRSAITLDDNNAVDDKSVADAIEALKTNHGVLFSIKPKTPDVKRAKEQDSNEGYSAELRALQSNPRATRKDLEALRTKYGK